MDSDDLFFDFDDEAIEQSMIFIENAISQGNIFDSNYTS